MLQHSDIVKLVPHAGAMCLLDRIERWSADSIDASAISHLDPGNPLRRDGCLPAICGVEYGLQAAAAHGSLSDGARQAAGFLVALRALTLNIERLDTLACPRLDVHAHIPLRDSSGLVVAFSIRAGADEIIAGRASIYIPRQGEQAS